MNNRWIVILAAGSILTSEAINQVDKHGCYWLAPDHSHVEKPEGDASASTRSISVDSGAATATTGSLALLNTLGVAPFLIVS
jgi:hypothetical protein